MAKYTRSFATSPIFSLFEGFFTQFYQNYAKNSCQCGCQEGRQNYISADKLPADARSPITVLGRSWMLVAFRTISMIMAGVAIPLPSSRGLHSAYSHRRCSIAKPSMLADILRAIIFSTSSLFVPKSFLMTGFNRRASFCPSPLTSTSSKRPSQTAYTAHKDMQREKPLRLPQSCRIIYSQDWTR